MLKRPGRKGTESRNRIIQAALEEAEQRGYRNVNRMHISERLGISSSLVNRHIGNIQALHEAIVREAVAQESIPVITQLLLDRHPYVVGSISEQTKEKVIAYLFAV